MKLIKKIIVALSLSLIMSMTFSNADGIYSNNYKVKNTTPVTIKDDRAYITAKDLSIVLGGTYTYDVKTNSTTIKTDTVEYKLTAASNMVSVNGSKRAVDFRPYLEKNSLFIPVSIIGEFSNVDLYWNYKTKNLLVNSKENSLKDDVKYENKTILPMMKKTMGTESEKFSFNYALTEDVSNEKYMTDGTYFVFKANEKGNIAKKINGFFYFNTYTNDVYFYPIDAENKNYVKKYSNAKEIENYVENGKSNTAQLIATTKMINDIKSSDTSLAKFSYVKKASIDKKYFKELPKGNYYYYQASKKENNKLVPQFDVAQNSKTLELFLFLKDKKGVNVLKLPDKTIIKTIAKK